MGEFKIGYKKHNWMDYARSDNILEITIKDNTGRRIDFFRSNNRKDSIRVLRILKEKYGLECKPEIPIEKSINFDKEIDWLKKETES